MNPEQISRLLDLLEQIAKKDQTYTITGAADWPILAAIGIIIVALIGAMWNDQRSGMKEYKTDLLVAIKDVKDDSRDDIDNVWKAMRDCKTDCCRAPRSNGKEG